MINYALTFLTICPSNWKVWYYEGRPNPEHKSDLQLGNSQFFLNCQKSAIYVLITWAKEKKSISFLLYYFLFGDRRLYWIRQGTNFEQNVKYYHPNFTPSLEHCVFQGMHCIFKKKIMLLKIEFLVLPTTALVEMTDHVKYLCLYCFLGAFIYR